MGEAGEPLASVLGDEDRVLDSDASHAGDVDSRFGGHYVARLQDLLRFGRDVDRLVDVHADAVSEGMDELVLELGLIYDLPGGEVRRIGLGSRTVLRDTCLLSSGLASTTGTRVVRTSSTA